LSKKPVVAVLVSGSAELWGRSVGLAAGVKDGDKLVSVSEFVMFVTSDFSYGGERLFSHVRHDAFSLTGTTVVDVRTVAEAHVLAALDRGASGRYLLSSPEGVSQLEMVEMLRRSHKFDNYPLPTKPKEELKLRQKLDNRKSLTLGVTYLPPERTVVEMAEALIAYGLVQKK